MLTENLTGVRQQIEETGPHISQMRDNSTRYQSDAQGATGHTPRASA